LVALLKGVSEVNEALLRLEEIDDELSTTIISAYELIRGAYVSSTPEKNLAEVQDLLSNIQILDLTLQACEEASKIYRELRKNGRLIGEHDVLIAGIVKASAGTLLTRDSHFRIVEGLDTIKW
jgi:predicted nucleic acid-binding protein